MTDNEFNNLILKAVEKTLIDSKKEIVENLLVDVSDSDTADEKLVKIVSNSVYYSVKKSVLSVLELLEGLEIINPKIFENSSEFTSALNLRLMK